jgi:negative regulator of sigma E activity
MATLNVKDLKALAYDRLVQIDALQRELVQINQQISNLLREARLNAEKGNPNEAPNIARPEENSSGDANTSEKS